MTRFRRPASLRALPALARRQAGLGCTLMLGLALATISASDPVSAEQPAAGAPPAHSVPAHSVPAHSVPAHSVPAHSVPAQPVAAPAAATAPAASPAVPASSAAAALPAAPALPAATVSPAAGAAAAPTDAASSPQPSQVPYEPVAGAVSSAPAAAAAAGADPVADIGAQAGQASPAGSAAAAPTPSRAAQQAPAPQASAAPRSRSLLPLVQPLWSELSDSQRKILAPLESQWNTLTLAEKRPWLTLAARLPKMKTEERARAEKRIREWAALTPEQRRLARNNYRLAKKLPKEQRVATWEQYQQMTPEQQAVLRQAGWTSNTAARHAGAPTGLAKEAAQPLWRRLFKWIWDPEQPDANGKPAGGASK